MSGEPRDMDAPRVSIVLPTWNGSTYLAESIASCLQQTYADLEVVVVDDASTDETPFIIAECARRDPRVRPLRHEKNTGLPRALNTGFAAARGEYLTWTSDDNRFFPMALDEMAAVLDADPAVAHVYADLEIIDGDGRVLARESAMEPRDLVAGHDRTGIACFLYRRGVYERVGDYAEDLFLAEDYDYWLRMLGAGLRMHHLPKTLYQYRRHASSLTDVYRGRTFLAAERSLLRNLPTMTWLDRSTRGQAHLYLASLATWRGSGRDAVRYTLRAATFTPGGAAAQLVAFGAKRLRRMLAAASSRVLSAADRSAPRRGPTHE